jgi:hypothetical protein
MHGVLKLRKMVQNDPEAGWRERYGAVGTEEVPEMGGHQDSAPEGGTAGA